VSRAQHDVATAGRLTEGTLRVTGVVACPLFLGIAALAPVLVPAVFGESWNGAVPVVQIIMLLGVLASMSVVQAAVIRGMGKPHWEIVYELAVLVATAVFLLLSLPWGLDAAAAAVVLGSLVTAPINARFVRDLTGLPVGVQVGAVFNAGLASLLMATGVWLVSLLLAPTVPAPVLLPLLVVVGAFLYWVLLKWSMPVAARVIQDVAVAVARRDIGAVRATLGGLAG
jgi:PST family polysaccharide transporter